MGLAGDDFFATAAQVIATCLLVFAVESSVLRRDAPPGPTLERITAFPLLVGAVAGVIACFGALKDGPSKDEQSFAVIGLVCAAALVLVPALHKLVKPVAVEAWSGFDWAKAVAITFTIYMAVVVTADSLAT